jgi:hypothetical protein
MQEFLGLVELKFLDDMRRRTSLIHVVPMDAVRACLHEGRVLACTVGPLAFQLARVSWCPGQHNSARKPLALPVCCNTHIHAYMLTPCPQYTPDIDCRSCCRAMLTSRKKKKG